MFLATVYFLPFIQICHGQRTQNLADFALHSAHQSVDPSVNHHDRWQDNHGQGQKKQPDRTDTGKCRAEDRRQRCNCPEQRKDDSVCNAKHFGFSLLLHDCHENRSRHVVCNAVDNPRNHKQSQQNLLIRQKDCAERKEGNADALQDEPLCIAMQVP